ncbi:hypothetical protein ACFVH7_15770 [Kitasatospora indigofera]|uniref:hypothetical protein n=1 Tax=Kitasatospora indigofera TaxID=67307 RepID=UPI00363882E0
MHRTAKRLRSLAASTVVLLMLGLAPAMAHAAGTRPFSITITHVACVDSCDAEGLEAAFEGHADFFAKVFVNGVEHRTPTIDDNSSIDPVEAVKDGDLDLVLHFDTEPSGVRAGDTEVCVKGSCTDRAAAQTYRFFGCKAVRVLPF